MEAILLTFRHRFLFNFCVNVHARFWFRLRLPLCAERGERSEPSEAARGRRSHIQAATDKQDEHLHIKSNTPYHRQPRLPVSGLIAWLALRFLFGGSFPF